MINFNQYKNIRDIFETVPLDKILVETDAPFLSPIPHRGHRNQPSNVKYVAEKLAGLRDLSFEDIADITSNNFFKLFRKASDKGRREYTKCQK